MLTAALAILALSSCNKLVDHIKNHLDDDDKTYRIETWKRSDSGPEYANLGTFTYNANNDPTSLTFEHRGGYYWKFNYDKHKRLSETYLYEGAEYFEGSYREYRKYKYNNKGQIISDTTYEYGEFDSIPTPQNNYYWVTTYTYDPKGRVIKTVEKHVKQTPEEPDFAITYEFSYNEDGNLVRPGYTYDNKLSFLRTNKIWMFLSRDYSVNNPIPASSYNSFGLPLVFNHDLNGKPYPEPIFLWERYHYSEFTYKKIK
jgi:hypothetical protein